MDYFRSGNVYVCSTYNSLILSSYYQKPIIIQRQITVVITEIVYIAVFVSILMCHILKSEAQANKFFFGGFYGIFSLQKQVLQNTVITPQDSIDIADELVVSRFQTVVVIIAAIIIAKFFIGTAFDSLATG